MTSKRCPICGHHAAKLRSRFGRGAEAAIRDRIVRRNPDWKPSGGVCERCFLSQRESFFRDEQRNRFALLPSSLRLNADPRFTGRGVTIAFLDSGFFPHPELTKPRNRIVGIADVTEDRFTDRYFRSPHAESWHGTMSAVLACGNGGLSGGLYAGVAPDANLLCVKVMSTRRKRITGGDIANGLRFILSNPHDHTVRIINISVGADRPELLAESEVDQLVEEAAAKGIVVVAAVGNSPGKPLVPPATAPSAVTVGAYDDQNRLGNRWRRIYHSSYGLTPDGYDKPDLIAPGNQVAGPILPGTDQYRESRLLFRLLGLAEGAAWDLYIEKREDLPTRTRRTTRKGLKRWVEGRIRTMKYVGPQLKRMDGSSVAAAFVTSVVAQMIEANPGMTPGDVKSALLRTAALLPGVPREQQGAGMLDARMAVAGVLIGRHKTTSAGGRVEDGFLSVIYKDEKAAEVSLAGDFNGWNPSGTPMHEIGDGTWGCILPKPSGDSVRYKLVVDGRAWIPDPANDRKETDGFGGWNSVLELNQP